MKKIAVLLLALCLTCFLAACSSENQASATTATPTVTKETATSENATAENATAENAQMQPIENSDASSLIGEYMDSYSQRATADVAATEVADTFLITVHWSSSAYEYSRWTMTATLEGNQLTYTDCVNEDIVSDEQGKGTVNMIYSDGVGYFEIDSSTGNLLWTGAADESCQECVFEKMTDEK